MEFLQYLFFMLLMNADMHGTAHAHTGMKVSHNGINIGGLNTLVFSMIEKFLKRIEAECYYKNGFNK